MKNELKISIYWNESQGVTCDVDATQHTYTTQEYILLMGCLENIKRRLTKRLKEE